METIKGSKRKFEATMNFKNLDIIIEYDNEEDSDTVRRILMDALREMDTTVPTTAIRKTSELNIPTFIKDCANSKSMR